MVVPIISPALTDGGIKDETNVKLIEKRTIAFYLQTHAITFELHPRGFLYLNLHSAKNMVYLVGIKFTICL